MHPSPCLPPSRSRMRGSQGVRSIRPIAARACSQFSACIKGSPASDGLWSSPGPCTGGVRDARYLCCGQPGRPTQKLSTSNRKKALCIQISTNEARTSPKQCQLFAGELTCWEPCWDKHPQVLQEWEDCCEIQSLTCNVQCFKAEPAPKMLHIWKSFSLFSPNTFMWVSQDSCVAALAWPEADWESRRLCTSQLPASQVEEQNWVVKPSHRPCMAMLKCLLS